MSDRIGSALTTTVTAVTEFPLVSIVTPTYNQAQYLAETIESVLAQDYPHIEYIVLDDGSTDHTAVVLQRFAGRIRCERHANMGQSGTLNKGWSMARGALLGYLSSDDRLERGAVRALVKVLGESPQAVVAYCDFNLIDANGRSMRTFRTEEFDALRLGVDLVCQPGPGAIFRRSMFERAGGWSDHLRQVPDFEFWLRASRYGVFVRIPQVLADYRIHADSGSVRSVPMELSNEIVEVMERYWGSESGASASRSLANAHLIAAKSHAQSGRPWSGMRAWLTAMRKCPSLLAQRKSWSMLASGFLRRFSYRLQGVLR